MCCKASSEPLSSSPCPAQSRSRRSFSGISPDCPSLAGSASGALPRLGRLSLWTSFYSPAGPEGGPEADAGSKISSLAQGMSGANRRKSEDPTTSYTLFCLCCKFTLLPKDRSPWNPRKPLPVGLARHRRVAQNWDEPFRGPASKFPGRELYLLSANTQKGKFFLIPGVPPSFFPSDSGHFGLPSLHIHSSPGRE